MRRKKVRAMCSRLPKTLICCWQSCRIYLTVLKEAHMQVNPGIFKSYDIRGIYGKDLFDETGNAVAKAFTKILSPKQVVVGRDARISSPSLHQNIIAGFTASGVDVVDIGMVSTDMYYFACATKKLPGIMVTASHNPKEYNGFKMVRQIPYLLSGEEGIQDIRKVIETDAFLPE